jgi:imidazolonepropionase
VSSPLLLTDIGQLVTCTGSAGSGEASLGVSHNTSVLIQDGLIRGIGPDDDAVKGAVASEVDTLSMDSQVVIPGFVDSHTHIVFGGDRVVEFNARMSGAPYIAGGIGNTVSATRRASKGALVSNASALREEMLLSGSTTVEVKSGYGLTVEHEKRSLEVAQTITDQVTFLGGHLVPEEYAGDPESYVDAVCGPMLEHCAPYARFVDVFLEKGAFDAHQARRVLTAGVAQGLIPTLHASQLGPGEGAKIALEVGAASLSHGNHLTKSDLQLLRGSRVVVTALPGTDFSTAGKYLDVRPLHEAGITVSLASNCNPGSSFSSSMLFMIALAVREMSMSPADAVWSATAGGAAALRLMDRGQIRVGARADMIQLAAPDYAYVAYRPGVDLVRRVFLQGELVVEKSRDVR